VIFPFARQRMIKVAVGQWRIHGQKIHNLH
jgi:hypothetical protein